MPTDKFNWFIGYISDVMDVGPEKAKQIYYDIANDSSSVRTYTPSILFPLIHYLLDPWKGYDCAYRVFETARAYGLPSVYPLCTILQHGLSITYVELLKEKYPGEREVLIYEQLFEARWLAALGINDLRIRARADSEPLSDSEHRALSNAWSLANRLLSYDLNLWKRDLNRFPQSGPAMVMSSALRDTERALREIASS
ncbi:MAG TPA: hypothetical protein VFD70_18275 [Anaerolineae bacterium]|nr:hypothetical protein [Anaerolineae bacterium]